jgi:signal transduction histidine kinase/ligand-binding sensor domain-containing protein/DNA-binding response OmpR family regulator
MERDAYLTYLLARSKMRNIIFKLCFTLFLITRSLSVSGQETFNFIHLEPMYANEKVTVQDVAEDGYGFIWLRCSSGLMRYDGEQFTYRPLSDFFVDPEDQGEHLGKDGRGNLWLSSRKGDLVQITKDGAIRSFRSELFSTDSNSVVNFVLGIDDSVWLGSKNGTLFAYGYGSGRFEAYARLPSVDNKPQIIRNIIGNTEDKLWISTRSGKVYSLSVDSRELIEIMGLPADSYNSVNIATDKNDRLWIGTESHGLFLLDSAGTEPHLVDGYLPLRKETWNSLVLSMYGDSSGRIWVATDGDGVHRINPACGSIRTFTQNGQNGASLSENTIVDIFEDSKQNLWFVDKKGIINVLPYTPAQIRYHPGTKIGAPTRVLTSIRARDGALWIGTDGQGLHRQSDNGDKTQFSPQATGIHRFSGKIIQSLTEDESGNIWVATYLNGLWRYNAQSGKFTKVEATSEDGRKATDVRTIYRDSKNRIWVSSNAGIHVFAKSGKLLAHFNAHRNNIYGNVSQSMYEDASGTIWLAMNLGGLFKLEENEVDFAASQFRKYIYHQPSEDKHKNVNICGIRSAGMDTLWLITIAGDLIQLNTRTAAYENFSQNAMLKGLEFLSLEVDDAGRIWLGTERGLVRYEPANEELEAFYRSDGLQSNNFYRRSSHHGRDGYLYFGTQQGLHFFRPEEIHKNELESKLHITQIGVLNQPAESLLPEQFEGGVLRVNKLRLRHDQASFSIQFSTLRNVLYSHFRYAYRLKGFDEKWVVDDRNIGANYTNIPPGEYDFQVKASSREGVWDVPVRSLNLSISPPWWWSNWAYAAYGLIFLVLMGAIVVWLRLRGRLARQAWTNRKERELYAMKMNFFAKMSHEIQTPLTLILGPIEDMMARTQVQGDVKLRRQLRTVSNNARRLSRIALELASLRKKELGKLKIHPRWDDFVDVVREVADSFGEHAEQRNIEFTQKLPKERVEMWFDGEFIEHILYNLLSNAFKFTPAGGTVSMEVTCLKQAGLIEVSVKDTGKGIPESELDNIFRLYYQAELGRQRKGNGIGLALVKEIVELHQGNIRVKSSNAGSCFTITLTTARDAFAETRLPPISAAGQPPPAGMSIVKQESVLSVMAIDQVSTPKAHSILIVEDNLEMQTFLREIFETSYNVYVANDGKEGFELARKFRPDLVVSDVIMPEVDGIEMSRMLLREPSLAHTPVILLSAQNEQESKLRGLQSGAVSYMGKPFSIQELLIKVNNIIGRSNHIIGHYRAEEAMHPEMAVEKSNNELFLEQLVLAINQRMNDRQDFSVEELAPEFNVSYSALYRRCQSLTGKTLVEFARLLRLRKGVGLMLQGELRVSEAAYTAGFSSVKYFSRCFKAEFGLSPNAMRKEAKTNGTDVTLVKYGVVLNSRKDLLTS